ncbi:MAG: hypothetical protein ACI9PY_000333 [Ascidiaceihabitans sp.]|jgi:hypothetical protein
MLKPAFMTLGLLVALVGCDSATKAVDDVARRSAKASVSEALATRFPAVPNKLVTPFTDCIIDNSSGREIAEFAKDAVVGVDEATVVLVRSVLERPETVQCVTKAGLSVLG